LFHTKYYMKTKPVDFAEFSYLALSELPEAVFWFDEKARFMEVNNAACVHWGYTREEFLKMTIFDVNPNMNPELWETHWKNKIADSSTFESTHRKKDGTIFPVDITDNFVELNGKIYSCAIIRDISAQKAADRTARLSDFTVQRAGDAIFWVTPEGLIENANQEAQKRYGYSAEELSNMSVLKISNMTKEIFANVWVRLRAEKQVVVETVHLTKTGEKIDVEISANYIEFEEKEYSCSIARDITERKRKEAALRGALEEIRELRVKLEAENNYLHEEIEIQNNFGEIVTGSAKFKKVLKKIEQVADTASTVLITGESGTGKELLARAVHQLSRRSERPLIKVNCAALPANLIESELFGHEKGAFTGALHKKLGKFELADGGTLFLDEIGEMPIDLQSKLLRAIQEGEIERLGSESSMQVDVRLIAATNRDLPKEIEDGNFREDLYYRLNVFPVNSIPLRKRKEDIPILARYFCEKLGTKLGRKITDVPQKVIDKLMSYDFPGNIRELENLIERGIITSRGGKLNLSDFNPKQKRIQPKSFQHLEEVQKQYITEVLQHTEWRVSGAKGAALILGIPATTLYSKMDRLGIKRSMDVKQ